MMETPEDDDGRGGFPNKLARILAVTFAAILVVFGFSMATAGAVVLLTHGAVTVRAIATIVIGATVLAIGAYLLYRLKPLASLNEPVSDSVRKTRRSVMWSAVLGFAIGIALVISDSDLNAFSNGPIDRTVAIVVTLAYVVLTPIFAIYWHRNADEFERTAYEKGSVLALYAYSFITPGWWMLTRAEVLPPQDPMIVFMIVVSIWGIAWIANKTK